MYGRGVRHGAPFVLVVMPFSVLFGVVATEAGLNLAEVMGFSVLVIAGAAQFTALQLMVENAPIWIVLATALAVNLRMAMYSASLAPWLGRAPLWKRAAIAYLLVDQSYALSVARFESEPALILRQRLGYFFGVITPVAPLWYLGTWIGAVAGSRIPPEFALDFAVPITFIAMIAPALRTLAHIAAAAVSVVLSLALAGLPYGSGLLAAAMAAMATGAQIELFLERRQPWT
jgi:predicted branched-subunit amino acid permease